MRPRTVAIVQARLSSSRLPGKVLKPLRGMPSIIFMTERLRRSRLCDEICVATSDDPSDDELVRILGEHGVSCYRGPLDDVLARFEGAADAYGAEVIVRLTGDCPFIDPSVVDRVISLRHAAGFDYASNVEPPSYPDGLDTEVFTRKALRYAKDHARGASDREHVTPVLRRNDRSELSQGLLRCVADLSGLRWTVDYADDFEFVTALADALGERALEADMFDYLRIMESGQVVDRRSAHLRNEAYRRDD